MPMETSMQIGIRPVDRPKSAESTEGVSRRDDNGQAASSFSPKTAVSIRNAIRDMAGILSGIASHETEAVEQMPQDIQKFVQNVMKQAFSMDETISRGLGSSMESQRFSMEQLTTFSRMLSQMGALAEQGTDAGASDILRMMLTNLKQLAVGENGPVLEPVLLLKASFDLLNGQRLQDLPQGLQDVLSALQGQTNRTGQSETTRFFTQLMQYFIPKTFSSGDTVRLSSGTEGSLPSLVPGAERGSGESSAVAQQGIKGGMSANGSLQPGAWREAETVGKNLIQSGFLRSAASDRGQLAQEVISSVADQQGQAGRSADSLTRTTLPDQAGVLPGTSAADSASKDTRTAPAGNMQRSIEENNSGRLMRNGAVVSGQVTNASMEIEPGRAERSGQYAAMRQADGDFSVVSQGEKMSGYRSDGESPLSLSAEKTAAGQQNPEAQQKGIRPAAQQMESIWENTPQSTNSMKDFARYLLRHVELDPQETIVLQQFAASPDSVMKDKEARAFQQLIHLCEQNTPAAVQQAARQQDIPDLSRLWAFMQLCDMASVRRTSDRQLKKAAKDVATFIFSMRSSMEGEHAAVPGQRSLNFMMPMYMTEDRSYPAYIHVYDEKQPDPDTGIRKKETWLRICVLTDYIGAVELTCRIYDGNQLDLRVFFSSPDHAEAFRQEAGSLRESMKSSALKLHDFKIGSSGMSKQTNTTSE